MIITQGDTQFDAAAGRLERLATPLRPAVPPTEMATLAPGEPGPAAPLGTVCYFNAGHTPGLLRDGGGIAGVGVYSVRTTAPPSDSTRRAVAPSTVICPIVSFGSSTEPSPCFSAAVQPPHAATCAYKTSTPTPDPRVTSRHAGAGRS